MVVILFLLHFTSFFIFSSSQNSQNSNTFREVTHPRDLTSNFQPSLAIVLGILSVVFSLTFITLLYAKFCHRLPMNNTGPRIQDGLLRSRSPVALGLDETRIESLPFFCFSSLKGSRQGLECAVCLSKFEDIEVLRLLPKCRHAFHIDCIDQWLEKQSNCPLCRQVVALEDVSLLPCSDSLRYICQSQTTDHLGQELYVEREAESHYGTSSRFCIGSSFRHPKNDGSSSPIHKLNHKIIASDVILKSRWSNISSSDLTFLNAEMFNHQFSFPSLTNYQNSIHIPENGHMIGIKEEMERKRAFEAKIRDIHIPFPFSVHSNIPNCQLKSSESNHNDNRSMSEIITHPRFMEPTSRESTRVPSDHKEERMRRLWLPIARKTIYWFENRERRHPKPQQTLDV